MHLPLARMLGVQARQFVFKYERERLIGVAHSA